MNKLLLCGALLLTAVFSAAAENEAQNNEIEAKNKIKNDILEVEKKIVQVDRYTEDRITLQVLTGPFFSDTGVGPSVPDYNYMLANARLGWMLNSPSDNTDHPLRGCAEAIFELSGAGVMSNYGNVMFGPTFLVRYNFVQPDWKIVPYIQGGAGIVYNDGYEEADQRALGQAFEFTPQASVGARFLVARDWSIDAEFMFHHISNACIANRNLGVNAFGGMIGVTYFFDKLWE